MACKLRVEKKWCLHIINNKKKFSAVHTSRKIAYTKMYRTKKLINQFLNKVEYPV